MKREFLEELGLEKAVIDAIMEKNGEDINKLKAQNSNLDAQIAQLKSAFDDRGKELDALKSEAGSNEELKKRISEMQEKFASNQADFDKRVKDMHIDYAINLALQKRNARNPKAAKALIDFEKIGYSDKGEVTGVDEQLDALVASDAYLFGDTKPQGTRVLDGDAPVGQKGIGAEMAAQFNGDSTALNW